MAGIRCSRRFGRSCAAKAVLLTVLICGTYLLSGKYSQPPVKGATRLDGEPQTVAGRKLLASVDSSEEEKQRDGDAPMTSSLYGNTSLPPDDDNGSTPEHQCTPPAYHEFPPDAFTTEQRKHGALIIHVLVATYMFIALAIVCDVYFVASLEKICEKLHLSEDVAGATFMAAGSSAPELFTSIIGVFIARGDVGIGTIVGSAVFNILFVIGICGILAGQVVRLSWWPLIRDSAFYAFSVIALIGSISDSRIQWYEAFLMLLLYCFYIIIMRFNKPIQEWAVKHVHIFGQPPEDATNILPPESQPKYYGDYEVFNNEDEGKHRHGPGNVIPVDEYVSKTGKKLSFEDACFRFMIGRRFRPITRFMAAGKILILERRKLLSEPAFLKRQKWKTYSYDSEATSYTKAIRSRFSCIAEEGSVNYDEWLALPSLDQGYVEVVKWYITFPLNILLYFTIPDCRKNRWDRWFMATFGLSIVWIAIFSYIMVWMVTLVGYTLGIPDSIMGITFLAAGTSVPDAMASVMVARQGQGDMAVSNTIGSNVFDILIGLALPWFIMTGMVEAGSSVHINSNGMLFSVILLFLTVILTIAIIHFGGWKLDRRIGFVCLTAYAIFLLFSILIEFNVFGYVNPPMCRE